MTAYVVMSGNVPANLRARIRTACEQAAAQRGEKLRLIDVPEDAEPEGTWLAEQIGDSCSCVIAAGGDGTVAAVAHVLIGRQLPLGLIPVGTGNMVARELGIPLEVAAATALQFGPRLTRRLDVMRIQNRTYLLNAGVGVNAVVADRTSRSGKSLFGIAAYVGNAIWNVMRARPFSLTVTVDGVSGQYEATDVLISNCGLLARGLHPNGPDIRPDDGHLDLCIVCLRSPFQYPWHYLWRWLGWHREHLVHERSVRHAVTLSGERSLVVQADGDVVGKTPLTVSLLPAALEVICP